MTNFLAVVTAFCACTTCCGPKAAGITASGARPVQGVTVALPRAYPLGSRVTINGHTYVGQDRTARRFDGVFDIYFTRHADALAYGRRTNLVMVR